MSLFESVSILAKSAALTFVLFVETDSINLDSQIAGIALNLGN
jgi:hypothetical protein